MKLKIIKLSSNESEMINHLIDDFLNNKTETNSIEKILKYKTYANKLPERILKKLNEVKMMGEPYIIISGLDVSCLPKTPDEKTVTSIASEKHQVAILIFSSIMGFFYKFDSKGNESFVEDVFPIKTNKNKQLGTNSVFLEWHVEDVIHPAKADYVALYCLRGNEDAKTLIFEGTKYFNSSLYNNRLSQSKFKVLCDETFIKDFKKETEISIFDGLSDPEFNYDPHFMQIENQKDQQEINKLKQFINRNFIEITLKPGNLLIFDNRRVIHSRTNYNPKYDGKDRWLLRTLIVESTWKLRSSLTNELLTVK